MQNDGYFMISREEIFPVTSGKISYDDKSSTQDVFFIRFVNSEDNLVFELTLIREPSLSLFNILLQYGMYDYGEVQYFQNKIGSCTLQPNKTFKVSFDAGSSEHVEYINEASNVSEEDLCILINKILISELLDV